MSEDRMTDELKVEDVYTEEEELETDDSLTYANGVIEKIIAVAVRDVEHVLGMKGNLVQLVQETFGAEKLSKGVSVEVTDDNRVLVNISIIIEYGSYVPEVFEDVKEAAAQALYEMTGLEVAGVNLRIEDIITREEYIRATKKAGVESQALMAEEARVEDEQISE